MRGFRDLRYGIRMLARNPGFTAAALICLTLGVGAITAIYSVVRAVVLSPLPYREPGRLIRVYTEFPKFPGGGLRKFWTSPPEHQELRRELTSWVSLEGWTNTAVNLSGSDDPIRVPACNVSGGLLGLLGLLPIAGRLLTPEDDTFGAPLTCVISHGLWQRAFGGDLRAVGRDARLNGRPCIVVGIMPRGFQFPPGEADPPEVWFPLQLDPSTFPTRWGNHFLYLMGRLKPGITHEQARREIELVVQRSTETASPNTHRFHAEYHPLVTAALHEEVVGPIRPALLMLLAAVGLVLLIACVNVANLLLARAEVRRREIAIRRAMGAGLPALARQLITEGLLLAILGGAAGVALAYGALRLIVAASPSSLPRMNEVTIDQGVLLFALLVSAATGLFFGLAPLAQLARGALNDSLKPTSGRTTATIEANRVRAVLVVGELALALVLL